MRRARKNEMLQRERQRLTRRVQQHLLQCGAKVVDHGSLAGAAITFAVPTRAGTLHVTPFGNWIACRFQDPAAASRLCNGHCNPHSGKWSFHFPRVTAEEAFLDFATALNTVLEPVSSRATSTPVEPVPGAHVSSYSRSLEPNEGGLFVSNSSGITVRRFEFSGGNSNKFWEVSMRGTDVLVRFGRIGTAGQAQVKSFPDEQAAAKHVDKLIREKTSKGYRETA
jgi:predicted DNA-binding WGR domain protein